MSQPDHRRVVERMAERYRDDPDALALVIVGSVARGEATEHSDVDAYLIVTDAAYERRQAAGELSFSADDLCDWPGGQAGGVVADLALLHDAAERGPEPTRFAFRGAFAAYARVAGLDALLARIPRYQEAEREEKMASFASQLPVHLAYLKLGEYSGNAYLLAQTAVELALFGGRLLLAHNRMLYPGRKWFMRELERAPEKPAGLVALAQELVRAPSIARATAFCDLVLGFAPWPQPREGAMARFQRDREQHWRSGDAPLAER